MGRIEESLGDAVVRVSNGVVGKRGWEGFFFEFIICFRLFLKLLF